MGAPPFPDLEDPARGLVGRHARALVVVPAPRAPAPRAVWPPVDGAGPAPHVFGHLLKHPPSFSRCGHLTSVPGPAGTIASVHPFRYGQRHAVQAPRHPYRCRPWHGGLEMDDLCLSACREFLHYGHYTGGGNGMTPQQGDAYGRAVWLAAAPIGGPAARVSTARHEPPHRSAGERGAAGGALVCVVDFTTFLVAATMRPVTPERAYQ